MLNFYKNKVVLVTGHTGFKGAWLSKILIKYGATVIGYSLKPNTNPNLFELSQIENKMISIIADIRNYDKLFSVIKKYKPQIVFHLAAQPLVRESYNEPKYTYETNFNGTLNLLETIRKTDSVKSLINITTDKVYKNNEWLWGYRETEELDGFDPYSNSKSLSELVTATYKRSFFNDEPIAISTVRAGNVIGGGDFSKDRIIPDCVRALLSNDKVIVRNPLSTRPYQHVLEPIYAYLLVAKMQYEDKNYSGSYNIGPNDENCVTTGYLVNKFFQLADKIDGWEHRSIEGPHEANFLKLDISKFKNTFNWTPKWSIDEAIKQTIEWTNVYKNRPGSIPELMDKQINTYIEDKLE